MAFTNDQNLEQPTEGSADWDTSLNANFGILERGQHFRGTTGMQVNTGEAVTLTGSGTVVTFDASSGDLADVKGVSYSAINSGEEGFFPFLGIVRSLDVNTVNLVIGQPVFVSSEFPGLLVSSDGSGSPYAVGFAVDTTGLIVSPFRTVTGGGGGGGTDVNSEAFFTGFDRTGTTTPTNGQIIRGNGVTWEKVDQVVDPLSPFLGARAVLSADLTSQDFTTAAAISWTEEVFDTSGSILDIGGVSPTRLTVPSDATIVELVACVSVANLTANDDVRFWISTNGGNTLNDAISMGTVAALGDNPTTADVVSTGPLQVTAGDYFELYLDAAGDSSVLIQSEQTFISMKVIERSGQNIRTMLEPVRAASTSNGTLATAFEDGDTMDGVTLATGDRILLKDQSTGAENGIYIVNATGAPTRAADNDADGDFFLGQMVPVIAGTANAASVFMLTAGDTLAATKTYTAT